MRCYKSLVALAIIWCSNLLGQTLEGKVFSENGIAILGVNVENLSNNQHTHTNEEGLFQLNKTQVGDTIHLHHVSHKPKYFVVDSLKELVQVYMTKATVSLSEVVLSNKIDALQLVSNIDLQINPVNSSQEILRKVPGLFIGQHAGGGKAEQIFLRGFDIDHGTDIGITVDGLPVNMVSHAHGQGYADLHFVIPETINKIDFGKGPYYQDKGNFTTAGYVDFRTKKKLNNSSVKMELGQFNTQRLLGMFSVLDTSSKNAYIASEFIKSDGPFDSSQNFNRINLFGKYNATVNKHDKLDITASYFTSSWDASGQIPVRAVESGMIGRFGAIDDTEGGTTSRTNVAVDYKKEITEESYIKNKVYFSKYDFELFSNFTFFAEQRADGNPDQIKQKEKRNIYGFLSEYNTNYEGDSYDGVFTAGINLRNDISEGNELSNTLNRTETLGLIQLGDINETNFGAYLGTKLNWKKFTFNPSVRMDYFSFAYNDLKETLYNTQTDTEVIVSPKLNVLYNYSDTFQGYVKVGKGFHSNDTRVVLNDSNVDKLPGAYGLDIGTVWKPSSKMFLNVGLWFLHLEQEFVYVGDAGIVEAGGRTRRQGVELSYRYQPITSLFWNLDANYTYARSIDEVEGQDYIPLAPDFTLASGLSYKHKSGVYAGGNVRYIKDRPANEDSSIIAEGYSVVDFNIGYKYKQLDFGVQIQNLFDVDWNETQFATESRLQNETENVEEIHFTPGTPFFAKFVVEYSF